MQPIRSPRFPILLLVLLLPLACSDAARRRAESQGLDAAAIVHKALEASGAADPTTAPKTTRTRHAVKLFAAPEEEAAPIEATLWTTTTRDGKERLELETQDGHSLLQIFDGQRSGEWEDGHATGRNVDADVRRRAVYRNILEEFARDSSAAPAAIAEIDDSTQAVQWVLEREIEGDSWRVWIDSQSALVTRIQCSRQLDGRRIVEMDFLFDHQNHGARMIPHRQVTVRDGRKIKESSIVDRQENIELAAETFLLPE